MVKNVQLTHHTHKPSGVVYPLVLLADNMEDASNVGGLFRIADALGVTEVILTGSSIVPPNNKIRRVSRSADKHVNYCYHPAAVGSVNELKAQGYAIVSLELTSTSIDIAELALPKGSPVCLVLGSENAGVSDSLLELSDFTVHIPMMGNNSSMNVSNACAIASYLIVKQLQP